MIVRLLALSLFFAPVALAQEVEVEIVEDHPAVADLVFVEKVQFDDVHKKMLKELDKALTEAGLDKATRKRILKRMHAKAAQAQPTVRMKRGKNVGKVEMRKRAKQHFGPGPQAKPGRGGMALGFGGPKVKHVEGKVHQHRGPDFMVQWHGDDMPPEARRHLEAFQRIMREHHQRKMHEKMRHERERVERARHEAERARHDMERREHGRRGMERRERRPERRDDRAHMIERVERLEQRLDRIEHMLKRLADRR
ncbi:MAG: hypothetical protein ACYTGN_00760 [Planctomycetota bacterium]|jgi:hypothetical protein